MVLYNIIYFIVLQEVFFYLLLALICFSWAKKHWENASRYPITVFSLFFTLIWTLILSNMRFISRTERYIGLNIKCSVSTVCLPLACNAAYSISQHPVRYNHLSGLLDRTEPWQQKKLKVKNQLLQQAPHAHT